MRLIDADELKERLKSESYWTYTHEYGDAIPVGWVMSAIDHAPTVLHDNYSMGYQDGIRKVLSERLQGQWIPVSERLPEENGYYLTSTLNDEVYCDYWSGINFNRTEQIIAWQPLPEPYKKGDAE